MISAYVEGDKNKKRAALCAAVRNSSSLLGYCNEKRKCLYRPLTLQYFCL